MKYRSKVSYGLLIFIFLIFFTPFLLDFISNGFNQNFIFDMVFPLILFGFILYLFFDTVYTIHNGQLKIRFGFFSFKPIEIHEIKEISKTSSILSSPAPSFDRIEIKHGKFGSVVISPKNKLSFSKDLVHLNPEIKNNLIAG
ncbi:MAG TPA: PH domain-containing protein [Marivirga sp.]|nr:PH domain-containing protein [Marivirga sp.]